MACPISSASTFELYQIDTFLLDALVCVYSQRELGGSMRRLVIAAFVVVSTVASAGIASAEPASPQGDGWEGRYAGVTIGVHWGGDQVRTSASNNQFCPPGTCSHASEAAQAAIQGETGEFPVNVEAVIGGGQFGYNWKLSDRWVAGIETDIQGLADWQNASSASTSADVSGFANHSVVTYLTATKRVDFLGTLRGRVGYLVTPRLLVYGTGGFAYGYVHADTSITHHFTGSGLGAIQTEFGSTSSVSRMQGGWTLGGGFEWMLSPSWSAKTEYLYYDLGTASYNGQVADEIVIPSPPLPYYFVNDVNSSTRFNGNIFRIGLNYRF